MHVIRQWGMALALLLMAAGCGTLPSAGVTRQTPTGTVFRDCAECPEMVVIPAGSFTMGTPDDEAGRQLEEGPQHLVTIELPFAVGRFEVTFDEWDACVAAGGCAKYHPDDGGWGRGRHPVVNVVWEDVQSYLQWLSQNTGQAYRLLSEAEWEYAARAGTASRFYTGECISSDQANYKGSIYSKNCSARNWVDWQQTAEAGSFPPNAFGLYDMLGNVWEWVEDCYHENDYNGAPADGSVWQGGNCMWHGVRGGAWYNDMPYLRAGFRNWAMLRYRNDVLGFRVARALAR